MQWYYEAPENSPQQGNCYDIPGDYFQALHNSITDIKTQNIFLRKENKNYDFIQQFVSFTSPPSHCSAILESFCWTQTVYDVLFQPHHTDMLFSFKSKLK